MTSPDQIEMEKRLIELAKHRPLLETLRTQGGHADYLSLYEAIPDCPIKKEVLKLCGARKGFIFDEEVSDEPRSR